MAKGKSRLQRTNEVLKAEGYVPVKVETWNQFGKKGHGVRQDFLGFLDIIALKPGKPLLGVQVCGDDYAAHYRKITQQRAKQVGLWLSSGSNVVQVWAWRKILAKKGGKLKVWKPRIVDITFEDLQTDDPLWA